MKRIWFSTNAMTIVVEVDRNRLISRTPPIARRFIGQPIYRLVDWLAGQGGFERFDYE